jgi:membrane protein DedA with SNARE-associated domain
VAGAGYLNIWAVNILLMLAAILGDSTAFFLGRKTGPKIFSRKDSLLRRARLPRRFRAHIGLAGGPAVPAGEASAALLEAKVRELRGSDA